MYTSISIRRPHSLGHIINLQQTITKAETQILLTFQKYTYLVPSLGFLRYRDLFPYFENTCKNDRGTSRSTPLQIHEVPFSQLLFSQRARLKNTFVQDYFYPMYSLHEHMIQEASDFFTLSLSGRFFLTT